MYKLFIVDDKKLVRDNLINTVNWEKYNVKIIGQARNGKEALKKLKNMRPDIVITDVAMPVMDGLELTEKILKFAPLTKIIILSGYDNFNYIQKAMRNKAFDYVLKPVQTESLVSIVQNAIKTKKEEMSKIKSQEQLKKQLKESIPVLKERFLDYILTGRFSLERIKNQYPYLDLNINNKNIGVMIIELEDYDISTDYKETTLDIMRIKDFITNMIKDEINFEIMDDYPDKLIIIYNYNGKRDEEQIINEIQTIAEKIKNIVEQYFDYSITIGLGRLYSQGKSIYDSYCEALDALSYKIFLGKGQIIYYGDIIPGTGKDTISYPVQIEDKLLRAIKLGNIEIACQQTGKFIKYFTEQAELTPAEFKNVILQLIYTIKKYLIKWDKPVQITEQLESEILVKKDIEQINSLNILEKTLKEYVRNIVNKINKQYQDEQINIIEKACHYIKQHYGESISVEDIASSVFLTTNYFSTLFKEKMNKTVLTYLTEIRMKKARELLENTRLKNYQIAKKVGYSDSKYFVKVFKKYVGMTPYNYRTDIKRKK